jgi:hypothetical protein
MSPDMNPVGHLWNYLGRKVNARTQSVNTSGTGDCFGTGMATIPSTRTEMLD